jgi:hypothetical protein
MEPITLQELLNFSSIGFSVMLILPRFRSWIKREYERKLKEEEIVFKDLLSLKFYEQFATGLDPVAFIYMFSALLILLTPLWTALGEVAYYFLILVTVYVVYRIPRIFCSVLREISNLKAILPPPRRDLPRRFSHFNLQFPEIT